MEVPEVQDRQPTAWAALAGHWQLGEDGATFTGPEQPGLPYGLALSDLELRSGGLSADITLPRPTSGGRIVFGHEASSAAYYSGGIGHEHFAYFLDVFEGTGWRGLAFAGLSANLRAERPYRVEIRVHGQRVRVDVDGILVLAADLPTPLPGPQVGVIAWGEAPVRFDNLTARAELPTAFVIMQYGEPFDTLYCEVIAPVTREKDFAPLRADDIYKPGIIIQDITDNLVRAAVVIAEITPENANVFYELGYAHALEQQTILLAQSGRPLPFDVSGYRCIYYDDTIGGKNKVENDLRRHLENILLSGF